MALAIPMRCGVLLPPEDPVGRKLFQLTLAVLACFTGLWGAIKALLALAQAVLYELRQLRRQNRGQQSQINHNHEAIVRMEAALVKKDAEVARLTAELKAVTAELQSVREQNRGQQGQIDKLNAKLVQTAHERDRAVRERDEAIEELKKHRP